MKEEGIGGGDIILGKAVQKAEVSKNGKRFQIRESVTATPTCHVLASLTISQCHASRFVLAFLAFLAQSGHVSADDSITLFWLGLRPFTLGVPGDPTVIKYGRRWTVLTVGLNLGRVEKSRSSIGS